VRARSLLLAALCAVGCDGAPRELISGEATRFLGQERWGGLYNPSLAGCTRDLGVGPGTIRSTWDELGRLVSTSSPSGPGESASYTWDGPCRTDEAHAFASGASSVAVSECDEEGWPVRTTVTGTPPGGSPEPGVVTDYANTYDDDGRLLMREDGSAPTVFEWWGNRLLRLTSDGSRHEWTYGDDGWVTRYSDGSWVTTHEYDGRGRLLRSRRGDDGEDWRFPSDDADLPDGVASVYEGERGSFIEVSWSCP
jgi:YD repeat-containing protein